MKRLIILLLIFTGWQSVISAQTDAIYGKLYDNNAQPLGSATVVLLNPADSTLEYFGITDRYGSFEIKNIKKDSYLLQASFIGFRSFFSKIDIPRPEGANLGDILLQELPQELGEVQVVAERVPLRIKGDTIEFDASAFKTQADDVTEDLIRKLPGIEVDRAGNIKALGEDVKKVYVDGKEFFGSDPTIATRNLPADAIDKIQVYDKKSDAAEFTGIDDGTRDKTINLKLKEDKKSGVFGDVMAGYGTDQHYKGNIKAYRFTDKIQLAALGMLNNVNQYGFSFGDYLDFSGGIGALSIGSSAEFTIETSDNVPINFGGPVEGLTTSGAGGLNFSVSKDRNNRTYISYLANGSKKDLQKAVETEYYTESNDFLKYDSSSNLSNDFAHRFNFGLRRRMDSSQNFIFSGNVGITDAAMKTKGYMNNTMDAMLMNELFSNSNENSNGLSGNLSASYIKKFKAGKQVLKMKAGAYYKNSGDRIDIFNQSYYFFPSGTIEENQFRNTLTNNLVYNGSLNYTFNLGKGFYLGPQLRFENNFDKLDQSQGFLSDGLIIDEFSPEFSKNYSKILPGIDLQYNTRKSQFLFGLRSEHGIMKTTLNDQALDDKITNKILPVFSWDYSPRSGRKLSLFYSSRIVNPTISQLLPVVNDFNPMLIYYGNSDLKPEYVNSLNGHWLIFDQFSFTSLMISYDASYTSDKINWVTNISDSLVQERTLTNVDRDLGAGGNLSFSTPIRKLGIDIRLKADERWNKGTSIVNEQENEYNTFSQNYSFSISNRKKKKVDMQTGISTALTKTKYELQAGLDRSYFDISWYMDVSYSPTEHWNIDASADLKRYGDQGFETNIFVPLLRAELSYYFLKNKRGTLILSGFDLLNRNQIVQRASDLNYLRETRSNTISRYFLLSFKYRLNKAEKKGGIHIEMNNR